MNAFRNRGAHPEDMQTDPLEIHVMDILNLGENVDLEVPSTPSLRETNATSP